MKILPGTFVRPLLAAVFLVSGLSSPAQAAYTSLYVFGDSLSDNGNSYLLTEGLWPPSPPYAQRLSNGPVAVERLAERLGIELAPSVLGGTGYAVGGATTGTRNFSYEAQVPFPMPPALADTGLLSQVERFVRSGPSFAPRDTLFTVWAGANDFFLAYERGDDLQATAGRALGNLTQAIGTLAQAGARDILVPNLPNLADIPFGLMLSEAERAALGALSAGFNAGLTQSIAQLRAATGIRLIEFDVAGLLDALLANPAAYGFSNVSDMCLDPANPGPLLGGCQGYLYFDIVHPTAAAHRLLGDLFYAQIAPQAQLPEPPVWLLLAVVLAGLAGVQRSAFSSRSARQTRAATR